MLPKTDWGCQEKYHKYYDTSRLWVYLSKSANYTSSTAGLELASMTKEIPSDN